MLTPPVSQVPDSHGRFGRFGGRYVPETLTRALDELAAEYDKARVDPAFQAELDDLLTQLRRPPVAAVPRPAAEPAVRRGADLSEARGPQPHRRPQDQQHARPGPADAADGQAARDRRDRRRPARRGHGHGLRPLRPGCVVYMGEEDIRRQQPNVFSMKLLGAEVRPVTSGSRTLRDAINEALRDWMSSVETTHYILGSVVGPHPFPRIVRDFQSVIGRETIEQCARAARPAARRWSWPASAAAATRPACSIRSSSTPSVELVGVEAGGRSRQPGDHAVAALRTASPGVLHGSYSYVLQDDDGQTCDVHSVSAGLDYPGVGPEHSYWKDTGRVTYTSCRDDEALAAFDTLARTEGILPALESSHAVAEAMELAAPRKPSEVIVVCLSGRGDKDAAEIARLTRRSRTKHSRLSRHDVRASINLFAQLRQRAPQGLHAVRHGRRSRSGFHGRRAAPSWSRAAAACANWAFPTAIRSPTGR